MRIYVSILLITLCFIGHAQEISFNFESDLEGWEQSLPERWHLDTAFAISGKQSLHHAFDNSEASFDMISYKHTQVLLDSSVTTWKFSNRYAYTPSSGNNWAVWLVSDQNAMEMHPGGSAKGYIIGVNYTGSDDYVKLWKQDNSGLTEVLNTGYNWQDSVGTDDVVQFDILRSETGLWELRIQKRGEEWQSLASVTESSIVSSDYLGVYYEYSSTHDMQLWLDDLSLNAFFYIDKVAPLIEEVEVITGNELMVYFNEQVDTSVASLFVLNRAVNPVSVLWQSSTAVKLVFADMFSVDNLLEIYNISDSKGNIAQIISASFGYYKAVAYDVVISEVMADSDPVVGQPNCEYVELYNRSAHSINLNNWKFFSGDREPLLLGDYDLQSGAYLLLISNSCESEYSAEINVYASSEFPTLPNSGETLRLVNETGEQIHSLAYSSSMFDNELKEEGGWSLELVDVNYPCISTNNWKTSTSELGGTPGMENSVKGDIEEYPEASMVAINKLSANSFELSFNQKLDSASVVNTDNFVISEGSVLVEKVSAYFPDYKVLAVVLGEELESGQEYAVKVEGLRDCSGIELDAIEFFIGVPENADSADVLFSEVLYESNDDIPEFIELYNNSDKVIDLKGYSLTSYNTQFDTVKSQKEISNQTYLLFPERYVVISESKKLLLYTKSHIDENIVIEPQSWSGLSNEGGKIGLVSSSSQVQDITFYAPEQHFSLLSSTSGVSLERVSFNVPATTFSNWHSAATSVDYSTPGEVNSQTLDLGDLPSICEFTPKEFSPDNDGLNDYVTIQYEMPDVGYLASINIYNQQGVLVNTLANNELLELAGVYSWNGLSEEHDRLPMGYYIITFEAWNPKGKTINEKGVVLLLPQKK